MRGHSERQPFDRTQAVKATLLKFATPLTTGLFLASLISGIALFLRVGPRSFEEMHEVLSMLLIVPFALHLWRNWKGFTNYFRRPPMMIALLASIAASGWFLLAG